MGKGLDAISQVVCIANTASLGQVTSQAARVQDVAEVAAGVFACLFLAVDNLFIAMNAEELHNIQKKVHGED